MGVELVVNVSKDSGCLDVNDVTVIGENAFITVSYAFTIPKAMPRLEILTVDGSVYDYNFIQWSDVGFTASLSSSDLSCISEIRWCAEPVKGA